MFGLKDLQRSYNRTSTCCLRYIKKDDVPAILMDLASAADSGVHRSDEWQRKWCVLPQQALPAAVLSYRWRERTPQETTASYMQWVNEVSSLGYQTADLTRICEPQWQTLLDSVSIQIELAVWLLWVHFDKENQHEYIWVDQLCIPQDVGVKIQYGYVAESVNICRNGTVHVLLSPVVDYGLGHIVQLSEAQDLVNGHKGYLEEWMESLTSAAPPWMQHLSRFGGMAACTEALTAVALKALMVDVAYMRRVWTLQEAVVATSLSTFPLIGKDDIKAFQPAQLVDWPQFNGWNQYWSAIGLNPYSKSIIASYQEGNYSRLLAELRKMTKDGLVYLAKAGAQLMWTVQDRSNLVQKLRGADGRARAHAVTSSHQVLNAHCNCKVDKMLATVPLVNYEDWLAAVTGAEDMVAASLEYAYNVLLSGDPPALMDCWSVRVYGLPESTESGFPDFEPRRFFGPGGIQHPAAVYAPDPMVAAVGAANPTVAAVEAPNPTVAAVEAPNPAVAAVEAPNPTAVAADAANPALARSGVLHLSTSAVPVRGGFLMAHPARWQDWHTVGDAAFGGQYNEGFRLALEWSCEAWTGDARYQDRAVALLLEPVDPQHPERAHLVIGLLLAVNDLAARLIEVLDIPSATLNAVYDTMQACGERISREITIT